MQGYVFILFLVFTTATTSSPVHNSDDRLKSSRTHSDIIRDMVQFKRKLLHEDAYPRYLINDEIGDKIKDINQEFNELEIIQLIPSIIDQMKLNRITKHEYQLLRHVFGSLFQLIVEETHRRPNEQMNPVLKSLFSAQKYRSHRFDNDIHRNTMDTIMQKYDINDNDKLAMKLAMRINRKLSPSQRILTAAALLIHENSMKNSKSLTLATGSSDNEEMRQVQNVNRPESSEKALLSLELLKVNESKRQKRNAIVDIVDDGDDSEQMKRLQNLIDNDDKEYSDEFYDQLIETQNSNNQNNNDNDGGNSDYGDSTYQDYAFDITATQNNDDDDLLRKMYGKSSNNDYDEYGTISELLQLAAKHSLRKQRNSDYLKLTKDQIGPIHLYDDDDK